MVLWCSGFCGKMPFYGYGVAGFSWQPWEVAFAVAVMAVTADMAEKCP